MVRFIKELLRALSLELCTDKPTCLREAWKNNINLKHHGLWLILSILIHSWAPVDIKVSQLLGWATKHHLFIQNSFEMCGGKRRGGNLSPNLTCWECKVKEVEKKEHCSNNWNLWELHVWFQKHSCVFRSLGY